MRSNAEVRAMFAALAAAYLAKSDYLRHESVDWLERRVLDLLPPGSDIREAVETFCSDCRLVRFDPQFTSKFGDRLLDRIRILATPVPPGSDRRDLNG
jgi:hypothetical protein